jgi:UDPglucose 6-dehydrogenase
MTNISVVGVGRLGICAALSFEAAGYNVLGCDVNASYVKQLNGTREIATMPLSNHMTLDKTFTSPEPNVTSMLQTAPRFKGCLLSRCANDEISP